jgi:KUP system potassium uptake protein
MNGNEAPGARRRWLTLGALGVVFGDIGTSPLYALRECFTAHLGAELTPANVLGVLSLIFWSLILIISVKYLVFICRADNKGEGGPLALLALAFPERLRRGRVALAFTGLGVFGAALMYGDGMITPPITVLGAMEGLKIATAQLTPFVVPLSLAILVGLFSIQRVGTGGVARVFGPVMLVWFGVIALLGLAEVVRHPGILLAMNPGYAVAFFWHEGWLAFKVLGAVFLVLTGGEALYADMGHFGLSPIRRAWFGLVLPALFLNYLGQGALLLREPTAVENPFYRLAPAWALWPLLGLATAAAIIASQALISGVFSLTMQAVQLGYLPRVEIRHTSHTERGQIYVPLANWLLLLACLGLVLGFRSSGRLAAAYGIAVTLTMLVTTLLFYFAARRLWNWSNLQALGLCAVFCLFQLPFLGANLLKFPDGGWFPVVIGGLIYGIMRTWNWGRRRLRERLEASLLPFDMFLADVEARKPQRVGGTAVFMSGSPTGTPLALLHNLKHNRVLHERVVLLTIKIEEQPRVPAAERLEIVRHGQGFYRVIARYGFMEEADMTDILRLCSEHNLQLKLSETTFFLSRETIVCRSGTPWYRAWRPHLFAFLARNNQSATAFFRLPANRVVELGMQVEI